MKISLRFSAANDSPNSETEEDDPLERIIEESFAKYEQALVYQKDKKFNEARNIYETLLTDEILINPGTALKESKKKLRFLCLKNLSLVEENDGNFEDALDYLLAASDEDSTDVNMWNRIGNLSLKNQKYPLARFAFEQAISRNPDNTISYQKLCDVLFLLGDFNECQKLISNITEVEGPAHFHDSGYLRGLTIQKYLREHYQDFDSRPIYESGDSFALSRQQAKNIIQDLLDLRESNRVQLLAKDKEKEKQVIDFKSDKYCWTQFGKFLIHLYKETNGKSKQSKSKRTSKNFNSRINFVIKTPANFSHKSLDQNENLDQIHSGPMDSLDQSRPLRKRKLSDASEKENSRRSSRIKQKEVRPFEVMEQNSNLSSLLPIFLPKEFYEKLITLSWSKSNELISTFRKMLSLVNPHHESTSKSTSVPFYNFDLAKELDFAIKFGNLKQLQVNEGSLSAFFTSHSNNSGVLDLLFEFLLEFTSNSQTFWSQKEKESFTTMILEISEHLKDYLTEVAERVIWNLLEYESQTNPFEKEENQKPDLSFSLKMVSKLIQVFMCLMEISFETKSNVPNNFEYFINLIFGIESLDVKLLQRIKLRLSWFKANKFQQENKTPEVLTSLNECKEILTQSPDCCVILNCKNYWIVTPVSVEDRIKFFNYQTVENDSNSEKNQIDISNGNLTILWMSKRKNFSYKECYDYIKPFLHNELNNNETPEFEFLLLLIDEGLEAMLQENTLEILKIINKTLTDMLSLFQKSFQDSFSKLSINQQLILTRDSITMVLLTSEIMKKEREDGRLFYDQSEKSSICQPWTLYFFILRYFHQSENGEVFVESPGSTNSENESDKLFNYLKIGHSELEKKGHCCDDKGEFLKFGIQEFASSSQKIHWSEITHSISCLFGVEIDLLSSAPEKPSQLRTSKDLDLDQLQTSKDLDFKSAKYIFSIISTPFAKQFIKPIQKDFIQKLDDIKFDEMKEFEEMKKEIDEYFALHLEKSFEGMKFFPSEKLSNTFDSKEKEFYKFAFDAEAKKTIPKSIYREKEFFLKPKNKIIEKDPQLELLIDLLKVSIWLDPNNLDDWILYGRSLIQSFEYDIVHRKAEDLQRQGFLEQLHQNLKAAFKCFQRIALSMDEISDNVWIDYGNLLYSLGSKPLIWTYEKTQIGNEFLEFFRYDENIFIKFSKKCFEEAKNLDGTDWKVYYMLGKTSMKLKEKPEIYLDHFRMAKKLSNNYEGQIHSTSKYYSTLWKLYIKGFPKDFISKYLFEDEKVEEGIDEYILRKISKFDNLYDKKIYLTSKILLSQNVKEKNFQAKDEMEKLFKIREGKGKKEPLWNLWRTTFERKDCYYAKAIKYAGIYIQICKKVYDVDNLYLICKKLFTMPHQILHQEMVLTSAFEAYTDVVKSYLHDFNDIRSEIPKNGSFSILSISTGYQLMFTAVYELYKLIKNLSTKIDAHYLPSISSLLIHVFNNSWQKIDNSNRIKFEKEKEITLENVIYFCEEILNKPTSSTSSNQNSESLKDLSNGKKLEDKENEGVGNMKIVDEDDYQMIKVGWLRKNKNFSFNTQESIPKDETEESMIFLKLRFDSKPKTPKCQKVEV